MNRFTIVREAKITGWGINTQREVKMKIRPGTPGSGVIFNQSLQADFKNAHAADGYTYLSNGREQLVMVEHFLASCFGLGITDIEVEVTGGELPFGDGSAQLFLRLLHRAGLQLRGRKRKVLKLNRPVGVRSGERFIVALPGAGLRIHIFCELDGVLPRQFFSCRVTPSFFIREIAGARTFGKIVNGKQVECYLPFKVREVNGWLIPARKRFIDEPSRHKALDLLGDLALLECGIEAEIVAFNPGHRLNLGLVRRLMIELRKE